MIMVNLSQNMNSETLMWDATIVLNNTHINDDSDIANWIPDQNSPIMPKGVDTSASNSNIDTNNIEHCDGKPRQVMKI